MWTDREMDAVKRMHIKKRLKVTGEKGIRRARRKRNGRMRRIMRWERTDGLKQ